MCHPIQHHAHIQTSMTMPPDPTLFLAHCKAHKTQRHSQPCKELKMPTHNPPTPADEYRSTFVRQFSNISLLDTYNSTSVISRYLTTESALFKKFSDIFKGFIIVCLPLLHFCNVFFCILGTLSY